MNPENMVNFTHPEDAIAAGYRPCEVCNPPTVTVPEFPSVMSVMVVLAGISVPLIISRRRLKGMSKE